MYRTERRSAAALHPLPCLQYAISDSALGDGSSLGLVSSRPHGPPAIAGLGATLRAPNLFSGILCGPGTVSRNLLSGGELGDAGENHWAGQRRSWESSEPLDQRGAGASVPWRVRELLQDGGMKAPD